MSRSVTSPTSRWLMPETATSSITVQPRLSATASVTWICRPYRSYPPGPRTPLAR
ncbi:hypothetical protein [Ktedonobacter racemifer]|uniref:hypothetical protein n=1 Tax=Ktedonobacter racemifer TaxID=363277 RepID=UPI001FCC79A8|nr:hypothetical protein [Ktedonobacter racemifer]